jgi:hypothetical protein
MYDCGENLKDSVTATADVLLPGGRSKRRMTVRLKDGHVYVAGHCLGQRDALEADDRFRLAPNGQHEIELVVAGAGLRTVRADRSALWSGARVPYVIADNVTDTLKEEIEKALKFYRDETPLRWEKADGDDSWVRFELWVNPIAAGSSLVGRVGGRQTIRLRGDAKKETVIHEMGHVIGLFHEQSRPDRNSYVNVLEENIRDFEEFGSNFDLLSPDDVTVMGPYNHRSVMHYRSTAFNKPGLKTIVPIAPPGVTAEMLRSNKEFDATELRYLKKLYPLTTLHRAGIGWGDGRGVSAMAFGKFTRPGVRNQVVIARNAGGNQRLLVIDDEANAFQPLISLEDGWGESRYATAVLAADVDGDGLDEIIVGRNAGGSMRLAIKKFNRGNNTFDKKASVDDWSDAAAVSSLAYGRDSDGVRLLFAGRKTNSGPRYLLYRVNVNDGDFSLDELWRGGENWPSSVNTARVALADVDGDGWLELIIATNSDSNSVDRLMVLDDRHQEQPHRPMADPNARIPAGARVTRIAAFDLDRDGRAELMVATDSQNDKLLILDDAGREFAVRSRFGRTLRNDADITCLAAADLDGDGMGEIVVGLEAPKGPRALVLGFDNVEGQNWPLFIEDDLGRGWGESRSTSAVAIHAGPGGALVATGRDAGGNSRYAIYRWNIR